LSFVNAIEDRQLLVVTGKGGVGKSTLASVLAARAARRGKRVLLLDIDPRESVHRMLGVRPSGGEILDAGGGLYLQNLLPQAVIELVVRRRVKFEAVAKRVLASPIYEHFTAGAPGLTELAILGYVVWIHERQVPKAPEVDLVILDAPATGHGVSMLEAPLLVAEMISKGPFGEMSGQVAELVADPERTGVVVVTLAEEMPVSESLELAEKLVERIGRGPEVGFVNAIYPALPADLRKARSSDDPALDLWRRRRQLNDRELLRFREGWPAPVAELPLLAVDHGPTLVDALIETLDDADALVGEG